MLVDVQRAVASENMAVLAAGIAIGGLTVGLLLRRGAGGGLHGGGGGGGARGRGESGGGGGGGGDGHVSVHSILRGV